MALMLHVTKTTRVTASPVASGDFHSDEKPTHHSIVNSQ